MWGSTCPGSRAHLLPPFVPPREKSPGYRGLVDRWQVIRFQAPSTVTIDVGVAPVGTGAPQGDRSAGVNGYVLNTMTPAAPGSCRYFWAFTRNYHLRDQGLTSLLRANVARVFAQDTAMLNAQQRAIQANPGHEFYNLNIDAGGMWARRLIDARVAAEQGRERTRPGRLAAAAAATRESSPA